MNDLWLRRPWEDSWESADHLIAPWVRVMKPRPMSRIFSGEVTAVAEPIEFLVLERVTLVGARPRDVFRKPYMCGIYATKEHVKEALDALHCIGPLLDLLDRLREELRL